jgi:hypothetical protein
VNAKIPIFAPFPHSHGVKKGNASKMFCIHTESRKRFIQNAVDKIEDTRIPEFNKAQQRSTSCPHLIETEAAENRALSREAGIRLGRRGSGVQIAPPRPNVSMG